MKELEFSYEMNLKFEPSIEKHRFTIKCIPVSSEKQQIQNLEIDIFPKEFLSMDEDSFGNSCIYGYTAEKHDHFSIKISGKAKTGLCKGEKGCDETHAGVYKYQTKCTEPGEYLRAFHEELSLEEGQSNLQKAEIIMDNVYEKISYVQGVTGVGTSAEEAMKLGKGVCQDYAHIMLSLCRMEYIPCRYVVGLLIGEGLSHAWVEIYQDGEWYAFDPTNHVIVGENHIKISNGRDYKDCTINQGLFTGATNQTQDIRVVVSELAE